MEKILNYHIVEKIDETKGSILYRVQAHAGEGTRIIKLLKTHSPTPARIAAFKREYDIIRDIDFPGIIKIYDIIEFSGKYGLVLEDFNGMSLKDYGKRHPLSIQNFLTIAIQISDTLGYLHKKNIIHMDIKPRNILIDPRKNNQVKLTDFGISTQMTHENDEIYDPDVIGGTLAYMSPEQTGRMNRVVDYRTDLYSLGIMYYELLTGILPFISDDPMEIIHAHLAINPVPPDKLNHEVPETLSRIVMKLISKTPEERYQNSYGLLADLRNCLEQISTTGKIIPFEPGRNDISLRFNIPQSLYGRDKELSMLILAFERVSNGAVEALMVSGLPGIGKSALINEIHKPIVAKRGYFLSGKFERFKRDVPYSALIQAFQGLVHYLLGEKKEMIETWKKDILDAVSPNGKLITRIIPDLQYIIGPQPDIPELDPDESRNRFDFVLNNFIKVLASPAHPIVLFLDDLQWADTASLQLLKKIFDDPDLTGLFFIGAYRSNETDASHPAITTIDDIKKSGVNVNMLSLGPLKIRHINKLTSELLKCDEEKTFPLAVLINDKTDGNPFFISQFLKILHDDNMLVMDHTGWLWDEKKIKHMQVMDNVVDLLANKITKLNESTLETLEICACIGNRFDLESVSMIRDIAIETALAHIQDAMAEGYINPIENDYQFNHDRIREAVYSLISENQRSKLHNRIGKLFLEKTDEEEISNTLFFIVSQLNQGLEEILQQREKDELIRLNLLAGKKAISSAAYLPAISYLETGISLLEAQSWQTRYDMTFGLYYSLAEAVCLSGDFEKFEIIRKISLEKISNVLDISKFTELSIIANVAQNKLHNAVQEGLTTLKQLGMTFPKKPTKLHILMGLIRVKIALMGKATEELLHLPDMKDLKKQTAMKLFVRMSIPAYQSYPELSVLLSFRRLLLSIKHGNAQASSYAYCQLGVIYCSLLENFDTGYKLCQLGLNMTEKFNDKGGRAPVMMVFYGFVSHWKIPYRDIHGHLLEGYHSGLETGRPEAAAFCIFLYNAYLYMSGVNLPEVAGSMEKYIRILHRLKQVTAYQYLEINRQFVLNLMEPTEHPTRLVGRAYDEEKMLPVHMDVSDHSAIAFYACHKFMICFFYEDYSGAMEGINLYKKHKEGQRSYATIPRLYFYDALTLLALYDNAGKSKKKRILKKVAACKNKLKKYADACPNNVLAAYHIVEAEYRAALDDYKNAARNYEKSIAEAGKSGLLDYEALANELTAKFYLKTGQTKIAQIYMQEARSVYEKWGASAKAAFLEKKYPELFFSSPAHKSQAPSDASRTGSSLPSDGASSTLDFSTVMKASRIISGEIVMARLLKRMMWIIIENAGAEKGVIILEENGALFVEAEGKTGSEDIPVLQSIPIESHAGVSFSIINYVARVKKTLILNNAASKGEFIRDPYIRENHPKSILCMPILNQGKLTAVLYLENNLATNAFTEERLNILNPLSSQIAVSIDNAKLYENLEQKVEERTNQLKEIQTENLKKAHRAGMADIAKETLHNIGNILSSVKTAADTLNTPTANSALTSLSYANRLLKQNMNNLQQFIINDPKGIKLMAYYLALEEVFNDEKINTEKKLLRLQTKVDDIIKVIHKLQEHINYDDTYIESIQLEEVVKFVLETKRGGLQKCHIVIREKYGRVPRIAGKKSKIVHILNTIIVNAKEAMESTHETERVLHIETEIKNNAVLLHIRDTGAGIPKENLEKIFFHGFTTKTGRSGHSLHNCANNMTEMGGKIWAESNGPEKGSAFSLEFPIQG